MDDWEKIDETSLPEKKKICTVILTWKILLMQIMRMQKKFLKFSKEKNRCI